MIQLFTDGACSGNPGPGGYAYIAKDACDGTEFDRGVGTDYWTTNNRMELLAVIMPLESWPDSVVTVVTDSAYVANGITGWLANWKRNGWMRKENGRSKPVKNDDLWRRLDVQLQRHSVSVQLIKGHSGHAENDECDRMAVAAYKALALEPGPTIG